jgi:hypothetical protein
VRDVRVARVTRDDVDRDFRLSYSDVGSWRVFVDGAAAGAVRDRPAIFDDLLPSDQSANIANHLVG